MYHKEQRLHGSLHEVGVWGRLAVVIVSPSRNMGGTEGLVAEAEVMKSPACC